MTTATGNHPYADAWPMLSEDDLVELAEDIAANGLLSPIVVDSDGLILDGRNRHAACGKAGVEPTFTVYDGDDPLGYVLSVNGARRHQSPGSRAASQALTLLSAGKRQEGRWQRGSLAIPQLGNKAARNDLSDCGVIADHAPDLLRAVRDDELSLNAAYEQACERRDAERDRLAEVERRAVEEAEARAFVEERDPDLAERVDGADLLSFVEARDLWNRRHHEEAERLRREKAAAEKKAADERRARSDLYSGIAKDIQRIALYGKYPDIESVMGEYDPAELSAPNLAESFQINVLTDAKRFIDRLIEWREQ